MCSEQHFKRTELVASWRKRQVQERSEQCFIWRYNFLELVLCISFFNCKLGSRLFSCKIRSLLKQDWSLCHFLTEQDWNDSWLSGEMVGKIYMAQHVEKNLVKFSCDISILSIKSFVNVWPPSLLLSQLQPLHHYIHNPPPKYNKSSTYEWVPFWEHVCKANLFISSTKLA